MANFKVLFTNIENKEEWSYFVLQEWKGYFAYGSIKGVAKIYPGRDNLYT